MFYTLFGSTGVRFSTLRGTSESEISVSDPAAYILCVWI